MSKNHLPDTPHRRSHVMVIMYMPYFANGDLVAFNFDGELQWSMNVGIEGNLYGYSASLAIHEHLLFVQVDQDEGAYVMALDALTGRELVWEHERNYGGSWASPALAKVGGEVQLVVVAAHVLLVTIRLQVL